MCLAAAHVRDDDAVAEAVRVVREGLGDGHAVTAEAPVSWPSGAFVSVTGLDDEARAGIDRSATFAAGIGVERPHDPPVRAADAGGVPCHAELDDGAIEAFLRDFADACPERGVTPLIENVPPVLRMRTGGVFVSRMGGHWADLVVWRERVPELGFTLDTSHAALFRSFVAAYPSPFGLVSTEGLELERYVEELGPARRSPTSPTRRESSARGSHTARASWTWTRWSPGSGSSSPTSSPRSTSPTTRRRPR